MLSKQPPGGHDATPLQPARGPTYTVKITFHRAYNVPVSDVGTRSADTFILAQINTSLPTRHHQDPPIRYRTRTIPRNLDPEWEAPWIVAGIPQSGFKMKVRVYDEDPDDHDDRLGTAEVETGRLDELWRGMKGKDLKLRKTGASIRAYSLRYCSMMIHRTQKLHAHVVISVELLGRTKEETGKVYTVSNFWRIHYSPIIGRLAGTKASEGGVERADFQANQIQLQGPVPNELYHRYIEFKGFVGGMFQNKGPRGVILHKLLHHQHERIYNFNRRTRYGELPDGPGPDMTLRFLEMAHFDQGGRVFTYVITLDGLFRFTETGKEFGIDLLSKHTMHSDVNVYIAWSGEFLVRRLAHPDRDAEDPEQRTHPLDNLPGGPPDDSPPKDPKHYELVIDNDSGTYRPDAHFLPILHDFLQRNFPGLHILTKSCTDEDLQKIKKDQKRAKKKEGEERVYGQESSSGSISSSDEEDLDERARGSGSAGKAERGVAFLEKPKLVAKRIMSGQKTMEEREKAEINEDQGVHGR